MTPTMLLKILKSISLITLVAMDVLGQVGSSFSVQSPACQEESLLLVNSSTNANFYLWDFCMNGLDSITAVQEVVTVAGATVPTSITVHYDSGAWYGFMSSRDNNKLFRLDFGDSLNNTPLIVDLGNVSGLLSGPKNLELFSEGGSWYGLLVNFSNAKLIRLDFSAGLDQPPIATDLGNLGTWSSLRGLDLVQDGSDIVAIVSDFGGSKLSFVDFGNSILNNPTTGDVTTIGSAEALINGPIGVRLYEDGSDWYGLVASNSGGDLVRMNFGTNLQSEPSYESVYSTSQPTELSIVKEGLNVQSYLISRFGDVVQLNFGSTIGSTPEVQNWGDFGLLNDAFTFDLVEDGLAWKGYTVDFTTKKLHSISFSDTCTYVSKKMSIEESPSEISYDSAGTYSIQLTAIDSDGNLDRSQQQLVVSLDVAPDVDFTTDNSCIDSQNVFNGTSPSTITSWTWDFGDLSPAENGQVVNHQYGATGSFTVTLTVVSDQGCTNTVSKEITIYNAPVTSFGNPGSNLCSNTSLTFDNTSTYDPGSPILWEWDFGDGSPVNNNESPNHIYLGGNTYTTTLTATLANGCISVSSQPITIDDGPMIGFSWVDNCWASGIGSTPQFVNVSETQDVTYLWDFGDGSPASTSFEPSHLYTMEGTYDVTLSVTSTINGCISQLVAELEVSDEALSDFGWTTAIENLPVDFDGLDVTGGQDSVISWSWDFSGLGADSIQSPQFTFPSLGDFDVQLMVTTQQGCSETQQKTVTVNEASMPSASFVSVPNVCLNENLPLVNTSVNGDSYVWDFCMEDLSNITGVTELTTVTEANVPTAITLQFDGTSWFGFMSSRDNNKLIRLDFGNELESAPTVTDLGDFGGILNGPKNIEFLQESGSWYGVLINYSNNSLVRLDFGVDLAQTPTATDLGNVGSWLRLRGLDLVSDSSSHLAIVSDYDGDKISIIDFGSSITNIPTSTDVFDIGLSEPLIDEPIGVRFYQEATNWYGLVASDGLDNIIKMDFGATLLSEPQYDSIYAVGADPTEILIEEEGSSIQAYAITRDGELIQLDFGSTMSSTPVVTSWGNFAVLNNTFAFDIAEYTPVWKGLTVDFSSNQVYLIDFQNTCSSVSIQSSNEVAPADIQFLESGNFDMKLTAFRTNGSLDSTSQTIAVSGSIAPDVSFSTANTCLSSPSTFTSTTTSNITTYSWDFGDGSPFSSEQSPTHQYSASGGYNVRLSVESDNGCGNFVEQMISIYDAPASNWTVPVGLLCSHNPLAFTNSSVFDPSSPVSWLWDFGDATTSTDFEPSHTFASGGDYTVTLTADLPEGCVDVFSDVITIEVGPATDFDYQDVCEGGPIQFTDLTTSSSPIVSWTWDFGDGTTSTLQNPAYVYADPGSYAVQLSVLNELGCLTTSTHTVSTYSIPVAGFFNEMACTNSLTSFFDQSVAINSNIASWEWDFGDGTPIHTEESPSHEYSMPGSYDVTLKVTTNFGCENEISSQIVVLESPQAFFTFEQGCMGETTAFFDVSQPADNNEIVDWTWIIDGNVIEEQSTSYTFSQAGDFDVSLTVTGTNSCLSTFTEILSFAQMPEVQFGLTEACEDTPIQLYDLTESPQDPIVRRAWTLDGVVISNDSSAVFESKKTGEVEISLEVTSANNCLAKLTETIEINSLPLADFEVNTSLGAYPLDLDVTNLSQSATTFAWLFGADSVTLNEPEPDYTFGIPGEFIVQLVATNDFGCADTTFRTISVLEPEVDAQLVQVLTRPIPNTVNSQLILLVRNNGTVALNAGNTKVVVSLGRDVRISEPLNETLYAFQEANYTLNFELEQSLVDRVPYICLDLETSLEALKETNTSDNEICIELDEEPVFLTPSPNPADERVSFGVVVKEADPILVRIFDSKGNLHLKKVISDTKAGLNEIIFDVATYDDGIYIFDLTFGSRRKSFRVRVN